MSDLDSFDLDSLICQSLESSTVFAQARETKQRGARRDVGHGNWQLRANEDKTY